MEKELTSIEVREMANNIYTNWEQYKNEIRLSAKSLYNMIALKKQLEEHFRTISDALVTLFENHGCSLNSDNKGFTVPPERVEEMNELMEEFSNEKITITYEPIKIKDSDTMPAILMDLLFEFIEYQD